MFPLLHFALLAALCGATPARRHLFLFILWNLQFRKIFGNGCSISIIQKVSIGIGNSLKLEIIYLWLNYNVSRYWYLLKYFNFFLFYHQYFPQCIQWMTFYGIFLQLGQILQGFLRIFNFFLFIKYIGSLCYLLIM